MSNEVKLCLPATYRAAPLLRKDNGFLKAAAHYLVIPLGNGHFRAQFHRKGVVVLQFSLAAGQRFLLFPRQADEGTRLMQEKP